MAVTQKGFSMEDVNKITSTIRQNFLYQVLIFNTIALFVVIFFDPYFFNHNPILFVIMLFGPVIPAYFADQQWVKLSENSSNYERMAKKHNYLKYDFLISGIVFSVIFHLIGMIHSIILGSYSLLTAHTARSILLPFGYNYVVEFFNVLLYVLVFTIGALILNYKFYRLGSKEKVETKINRFYDHPLLIIGHLTYFLLGSYLIPVLFYPFQPIDYNFSYEIARAIGDVFSKLNIMSFGFALQFHLIFPLILVIILSINGIFLPNHLYGKQINFSNRASLQRWVLTLIPVIIISSFVFYQTIAVNSLIAGNSVLWLMITLFSGYVLIYYLIKYAANDNILCQNCGFYGGQICMYCNNEEREISNGNIFGSVKLPRCPNCQQYWNNLSRRCDNCQYTIVLTCDNCSQTINPLWRKCNLCGEPRRPVPEIALSEQNDTRYSYSRARYVLYILLTIPFVLIDLISTSQLRNYLLSIDLARENIETEFVRLLLFDNYKRILGWFVLVVAILILLYRSSTLSNHPKLMVTDELLRLSYSELYILLILFILKLFIVSGPPGYAKLFVLIPLGVLAIIGFRRYRLLKNFRPFSLQFTMEETS